MSSSFKGEVTNGGALLELFLFPFFVTSVTDPVFWEPSSKAAVDKKQQFPLSRLLSWCFSQSGWSNLNTSHCQWNWLSTLSTVPRSQDVGLSEVGFQKCMVGFQVLKLRGCVNGRIEGEAAEEEMKLLYQYVKERVTTAQLFFFCIVFLFFNDLDFVTEI